MPEVKVKLGPEIKLGTDAEFLDGVHGLIYGTGAIQGICHLVVMAGIADDIESVELDEVRHDAQRWTRNVDPLKVEVHLGLDDRSKRLVRGWLKELARRINVMLGYCEVPITVIESYTIAIVLSGNQIGASFKPNRENDPTVNGQWCDEALRTTASTTDDGGDWN